MLSAGADEDEDEPRSSPDDEPELRVLDAPDDDPPELDVLAPDAALACFAVRPGSWPLASVPKISAQTAMNSVTVRATAVRRIARMRARRAARRG